MKNIVLVTLFICSFVLAQGTQLDMYDFRLQSNSLVKTKNGKIGFISVKPVKNTKEENIFGYWLSNNTNANAVFLEIKDGPKTIASVTAKDFSGKAKVQNAGTKTTATFTSGSGAAAVMVSIESDVVSDPLMPMGKAQFVDVKVKTAAGKNLTAVMTLFADGFVKKIGANGVSNSNMEKSKPAFPLVLLVGNSGTTVSTDNAEQKTAGKSVKLASGTVVSTADEVSILSFRTNVTTVKDYDKSFVQAVNLENALTAKKEKTELSLLNSASSSTPAPGDTITYTITYHNIGTAAAQDITISNPIPVNTMYVEKSAAGDGAEITVERKKVNPPQIGEVTSVNWKITKKVSPGEEGTVTLKAVIR